MVQNKKNRRAEKKMQYLMYNAISKSTFSFLEKAIIHLMLLWQDMIGRSLMALFGCVLGSQPTTYVILW